MKKIYLCESCGKVLKVSDDFAGGEIGNPYCKECGDEFGHRKNFSQIILDTKKNLIDQMAISADEAEKIAVENISQVPLWAKQAKLLTEFDNIVITDVGSTTTKALLLCKELGHFKTIAMANASTTVELPQENVNIGVHKAIKEVEQKSGKNLLSTETTTTNLIFNPTTLYLTTSSAGGGLQILVIGLTLFDSAGSGQRAAYGAGGVILDTFAIDDKRTSLEQMRQMNILHPDIILMAGGINGGAISPLLRLGELLQMAKPTPKFGTKSVIPFIFAGNETAQPLMSSLFGKRFDLYLIDNIRPTMQDENLKPARQKIHQLFMENVMEQAPGYSQLKKSAADDIIPTPLGVIKSLQLLSNEKNENIMSVDIGGATTDIFSNILGSYYRTVSANYGMSYSISNVMKEATIENICNWIPKEIDLNFTRNYISNKMLYPGFIPSKPEERVIEMAIAREAIRMAKKHHLKMNFRTSQIGFLDKLTKNRKDLEKITEAFYLDQILEKKKFHMHDINVLIGAGGIISHAKSKEDALMIIYDGLEAQGITEIWRDKNFITPHLGKLSSINELLAIQLLENDCFEELALVIRPIAKKWKLDQKVMNFHIDGFEEKIIQSNQLIYINDPSTKKINLSLYKGFYLNNDSAEFQFETKLPILIDTRIKSDIEKEMDLLNVKLTPNSTSIKETFFGFIPEKTIESGEFEITMSLPYEGNILVQEGDIVQPDTVLGENVYDPPKIYVISLFDKTYLRLNSENISNSIRIQEGDEVKYGQRIVEVGRKSLIDELQFQHYYFDSPVRGRVEKINIEAGTILMREIQDYSTKPRTINISKKLNIVPKLARRYMKKSKGDFVYAGDVLASRIIDSSGGNFPMIVSAPSTGTITEINNAGIVTICYDKEPFKLYSGLKGTVKSTKKNDSVSISYEGHKLKGIIGFGASNSGLLTTISDKKDWDNVKKGCIVASKNKIDNTFLQKAVENKVNGIITSSIDNSDLVDFIGKEIGVALTGNEIIPFTLIITEGFGEFDMDNNYWEFLKKNEGKWVFINGQTQIRAGVTRPTIIINK